MSLCPQRIRELRLYTDKHSGRLPAGRGLGRDPPVSVLPEAQRGALWLGRRLLQPCVYGGLPAALQSGVHARPRAGDGAGCVSALRTERPPAVRAGPGRAAHTPQGDAGQHLAGTTSSQTGWAHL